MFLRVLPAARAVLPDVRAVLPAAPVLSFPRFLAGIQSNPSFSGVQSGIIFLREGGHALRVVGVNGLSVQKPGQDADAFEVERLVSAVDQDAALVWIGGD